jgi:hypothetical protein
VYRYRFHYLALSLLVLALIAGAACPNAFS